MSRQRYSPRFSGIGKQFLEQAVKKNLVKIILTPTLRTKIREEFSCTDEDIDKAVQVGITEFGNDFKKLLTEQQAILTPPKEDKDEPSFFETLEKIDNILDETNKPSENNNDHEC